MRKPLVLAVLALLALLSLACRGGAPPRGSPATPAPVAAAAPPGFVLVPAGTFTMGSPRDEPGRGSDEELHPVTITRAFFLKRTELTHREWRALLGTVGPDFEGCEDCPVLGITWWEALEVCNRLSAKQGLEPCYTLGGCKGAIGRGRTCASVRSRGPGCQGYRLPTESEWELAARAATVPATATGQRARPGPETGWCGVDEVHPVGTRPANALGLHDMLGNASEWVWDWSGRYEVEGADPEGADYDPMEAFRVHRGGAWNTEREECRLAARSGAPPDTSEAPTGLRPARTAPGSPAVAPGAREAARAAATTVAEIDAEVRRIDAALKGAEGRELVFPSRGTMGSSVTVFELAGAVRKIVSGDFGESGRSSITFYYRARLPILALSESTRYITPVNDYGNPDAGKPAIEVRKRYYLAGQKLVRLTKDGVEIRLPDPRVGRTRLAEAAAVLELATRCPPRRPPCAGCSCETKDCRKLSCEEPEP